MTQLAGLIRNLKGVVTLIVFKRRRTDWKKEKKVHAHRNLLRSSTSYFLLATLITSEKTHRSGLRWTTVFTPLVLFHPWGGAFDQKPNSSQVFREFWRKSGHVRRSGCLVNKSRTLPHGTPLLLTSPFPDDVTRKIDFPGIYSSGREGTVHV